MGDYIRKIPVYNDYEKKKDLLKYAFLKDGEEDQRDVQKKHMTEDVQFVSKSHKGQEEQKDSFLKSLKNKLKEDNSERYYAHEKKFPFLIDTTVKKPDKTRSMRDVLNNIYEQDDAEKIRLSDDIKTKAVLLERRKELFLQELSGGELVDVHAELFLDPQKDYIDAVKNKNKMLTLKNYGLGQGPSDFVFSYPHIKAKGRGGYATEMVKSNILKNKNEGVTKRVSVATKMSAFFSCVSSDLTLNVHNVEVFLMKNRLRYINHTRNSHFVESYLNVIAPA
ncbi:hypothetical protein PVIIG_06397 [Plasmodium vivax India VII]|uniref:Uncharacterized protein n=2 Tax=Plasmodium vivax TaxID=5855 RepID=A5K573_PLAVS|nr:hypothetical protein, conserved [Plasmodium vivax]EDL45801.1 hypothetical protein, conserved [Plasmodium vivax]KMZ80245.1 hypothetical protein PVIIG_06397 [Plasmodium vivax India VII]|eukprot:XP_001615528.1 hypothetical protein [Plasmodium vivax Sal-1]